MMWHAELANPLIAGTKVLAQDQEQCCSQIQKCWCKVGHKFGQGKMLSMRNKDSGPQSGGRANARQAETS